MNMYEAKAAAQKYIDENIEPPQDDQYKIIDAAIKEIDSGWLFPYQTLKFILTKDLNFSVLGNWPIFVSKDGIVHGPMRPDI